jgi:hypothetical protein
MLFQEQPAEAWTEFDFMLIEALQILEDETCSECGNPVWVCRNDAANNVGFKIKTTRCFAKGELEKWREKQDKKKAKTNYGELPYIVSYTYDDGPLPSRSSYYKDLSDKIE